MSTSVIGYLPQNHSLVHAFEPHLSPCTRRETLAHHRVIKSAPKLSDFFRGPEIVALKGMLERPFSGLAIDCRRVMPGNLFFALPGASPAGLPAIDIAVSRGAIAIVVQKLPSFPPAKVTFIRVADLRRALALVAQRYYKFPDRDLSVIGVTGTHGKTSVAHLLKFLLTDEHRVGLLGSINYDLGNRTVPSYDATPEALEIYGLLAQMRAAGCKHAVVEASSEGIEQQRVRGLQLSAAVFTNLGRDHVDLHKTVDNCFDVKSRFFTGALGSAPKIAVVNLDDAHGLKLASKIASDVAGVRIVTFGEHARAQVRAEQVSLGASCTTFKLIWPKGEMPVVSPLVGRCHVSNLLAAIATAWGLGRDPRVVLAKLAALPTVPGRLERIDAGQSFNVVVDSSQTDEALRNALTSLRAVTPGKLHVVLGCAGNRDRTKRAPLARVAQENADCVYATSDNPRTEALGQIFDDMKMGVTASEKFSWVADRRTAIARAIAACQPGDCVLIAGKGHATTHECADTVGFFDDRLVARELLAAHATLTARFIRTRTAHVRAA